MKLSIVIPVYYNQDNLVPLYADIKKKIIEKIDYEYEIVIVNDGSKDNSLLVMKELAKEDKNIKINSKSSPIQPKWYEKACCISSIPFISVKDISI